MIGAVEDEAARCRADAALEAEGAHAGAGADRAFRDGAGGGGVERGEGVGLGQRAGANVGEIAVIAFENDWIDRAGLATDVGIVGERARHQRVEAGADGEGVSEEKRRLDLTELGELHQPGALAETVDDIDRGAHLPAEEIAVMRQQGRETGPQIACI